MKWPAFAELDLARLARVVRNPLLLDGRNSLQPEEVRAAGVTYVGLGR